MPLVEPNSSSPARIGPMTAEGAMAVGIDLKDRGVISSAAVDMTTLDANLAIGDGGTLVTPPAGDPFTPPPPLLNGDVLTFSVIKAPGGTLIDGEWKEVTVYYTPVGDLEASSVTARFQIKDPR